MTIASTTPAAQSDDPVLDELIGTATNTALLPEPDAHAYDDIATGDADPLVLGGHKFTSRFILGSGRYDLNLICCVARARAECRAARMLPCPPM